MKLTQRQQMVIESLKYSGHEWNTPMMLGGFSSSCHSQVLRQLEQKGIVESRLRNTLLNNLFSDRKRASKEYRLAKPGLPDRKG